MAFSVSHHPHNMPIAYLCPSRKHVIIEKQLDSELDLIPAYFIYNSWRLVASFASRELF